MNLEHRLQHAARDLREVPVPVPPLGTLARERPRSRVHTSATPVLVPLLFVAGALFAIGATRFGVGQPVQSDLPAVGGSFDPSTAAPVEARTDVEAVGTDAPSAPVEVQMIAEFDDGARSADSAADPVATPVRAIEPKDSRVNVIGAV